MIGIAFLMPYRRPASGRFIGHAALAHQDADRTPAPAIDPATGDARLP